MSEFKFACPVCGQHITSDSAASGSQLECPTCYRKIVVPQAPSGEQSKFILSAAQVSQPRPVSAAPGQEVAAPAKSNRTSLIAGAALIAVLAAAGGGFYLFREKLFRHATTNQTNATAAAGSAKAKKPYVPERKYDVPTNAAWSLDLSSVDTPDSPAAGRVHGKGFFAERATIQGGNLTFREGRSGPPELGMTVILFAQRAEDLSGKSIEIPPDRPPPVPKVIVRWRDQQGKAMTENVHSGYALKVSFGQAANGRIPGSIYLCAPDGEKSFVAGNFEAEIRKPNPPKQKAPRPKKVAP
jgi:hypothetical protein